MTVEKRVVIRRGLLSTLVPVNSTAFVTNPASGATKTIFDQLEENVDAPCPYRRLILGVYSSHASGTDGVIIEHSLDEGTNYDYSETYTLAATTATFYNIHVRSPWPRIRFTNSANTLTAWRFVLWGDESSEGPGV